MIVTSANGEVISILENRRGVLIDSHGRNWLRDASKDKPEQGMAGYSRQDNEDAIIFTKPELVRVCKGDTAIQQLTTVAEMRDFATRLEADLREIADGWNDQQLREVLVEADNKSCSALNLLVVKLQKESDRLHAAAVAEAEECPSCEREGTSLAQENAVGIQAPTRGNTPKKAKGNAFEGMFGEELVRLTSGQLAVMHAIFSTLDPKSGASPTASVAQCVSDEMSAVSAGATIATLKEKKLIVVDKTSSKKVVRLTSLGVQVRDALSRGKEIDGESKTG